MEQKDPRQIQTELAMPFAPEDLEWRLQRVIEAKELGIAVPYVTNRAIMSRLDDVVGAENWYNEFKPWHGASGKEAQLCGISIRYRDGFITKWDGAENSDIEPVKGGLSDSMKRAAVQWGIGRVLYNMDVVFVEVEKRGKTWYMKKDQQERLDYAYLKMLGKLGLTPAPAGGLRPQAEPDDDGGQPKEPQQENAQGKSSKKEPAGKPQKDNITYIVRNLRVNKGINSINTQLVLESSKGERVDAFARGEYPELAAGVVLTEAKLEKRQQDTIVYYMLEKFKIADTQPQAA
mgnify:CR=1 FL=1